MCELSLGPLDRDPVKVDMGDRKQALLMAVGPDNRYGMVKLFFVGGGRGVKIYCYGSVLKHLCLRSLVWIRMMTSVTERQS